MANPPGWHPKPPITRPSNKVKNKVNLDVQGYENLILSQGVRVKVYRTSYCPNVKSIDGAEHEIDCALCHGAQFLDKFPLDTWAFFQSQTAEQMPFAEGMFDGNTISSSFLRGVELQYFTLVELCDFSEIYIQRIKRQEGNVDILKYKGIRVNMLTDKTGRDYYEGSDFHLDINGNIKWCANKGPTTDEIYTINYETAVRFRAHKALHVNRFGNITTKDGDVMVKMPEQWLLEKDYLVERKDINGEIIQPNKIRNSDED